MFQISHPHAVPLWTNFNMESIGQYESVQYDISILAKYKSVTSKKDIFCGIKRSCFKSDVNVV